MLLYAPTGSADQYSSTNTLTELGIGAKRQLQVKKQHANSNHSLASQQFGASAELLRCERVNSIPHDIHIAGFCISMLCWVSSLS